ncbi:hypothetical protein [Kaistia terrae]|uniref:Uncharacterized protein n=1 Tax=Kaistia terrae TaxID=537017 RepID=A0ABW0Q3C5_9HYPH|nr:hypothetical protein [Kaistia terrae]MCX5581018.1 hypothetical protein [Kaistia terrae]
MMTTYRTFTISGPRGTTSWKDKLRLGLALVVGAGVVFAALVVSLSIALILIPVLAVVYLFRRRILRSFLARAMPPGMQPGPQPRPASQTAYTEEPNPFRAPPRGRTDEVIIDAEYVVVDPDEPRR